mmetsp:Transcript_20667/g.61873  ORF Transcript_20667/g.61873 Transcript_20667/m.61873 type:complete len:224 (-) Transcript_20667:18-689(-)
MVAGARARRVGRRLEGEARVVDEVPEGLLGTAATAAKIRPRAIDELLLGQGHVFARVDLPSAFEGRDGGERPARAAMALVPHGLDGPRGPPVHPRRERTIPPGVHACLKAPAPDLAAARKEAHVRRSELLGRHVGERIQAQGVGMSPGVFGLDDMEVGAECREPPGFLARAISPPEFGLERAERFLCAQLCLGKRADAKRCGEGCGQAHHCAGWRDLACAELS